MAASKRSSSGGKWNGIFKSSLIGILFGAMLVVPNSPLVEARGNGSPSEPKAEEPAPLLLPVASVALAGIPGSLQIGQAFSFTATFDNTHPTDVGYGPFIDVYFPVTGADGAGAQVDDGIDFVGAGFLGGSITIVEQSFPAGPLGLGPCTATQSQVNHPYAVDSTGAFVVVCGTPGDKLVTFQLPFGSFTPSQTPAVVTIDAQLSNLADVGTPLVLRARGGYQ